MYEDNFDTGSTGSYTTYQTTGYSQSYGENKEPEKKQKKSGIFGKIMLSIALGLFFGLFAGVGFFAVGQGKGLLDSAKDGKTVENVQKTEVIPEISSRIDADYDSNSTGAVVDRAVLQSDIPSVVDNVMPAMVSIVNKATVTANYWGRTYSQEVPSSGSGIIVKEDENELLIVTNNHVVEDANSLEVTFIDGTTAVAVTKGVDEDMDLAVISVALSELSNDTLNAISIAELGDSTQLELGESVIVIGNALGYGQSVTTGIVSAIDREITMDDGTKGTFIQTDAAINPGNSGGALLNMYGEVIGINSNKIGGTAIEGMGYAIPISSASPIIADLMERQTRTVIYNESERGYLGIRLQAITGEIAAAYNMPQGIYVVNAVEGGAAKEAGVLTGDIITKFDGNKIKDYEDLQALLQYYPAGETVTIVLQRPENGEYVTHEIELTLGSRESVNSPQKRE